MTVSRLFLLCTCSAPVLISQSRLCLAIASSSLYNFPSRLPIQRHSSCRQSSDARCVLPAVYVGPHWLRSSLSDLALPRQHLHGAADTGLWLNPGPLSLVAPSCMAVTARRGDPQPVDAVPGTPLSGPPSHHLRVRKSDYLAAPSDRPQHRPMTRELVCA